MSDVLERLKASLEGRYAIEATLGEGGMAWVYLARDLKHDREVAIKALKPELGASIGSERFLREIQVTAKLSHPHILPLYDSGEADGLLFYVMPRVMGESLADLIDREKQLSLEDAVRYTREVAEALAHAHSYGLVHRDIKPENIMISGGHAVVADFGIAQAFDEAGGERMTQTGMAVGTPAYMSPEQAAGHAVDGRSDVYSLGCMLYEMLVGQVPFMGPTPMAVIARHTMDNVTPPSIMRSSIPEALEDVIICAMAKTPADRFRTANEFAEALKTVESGEIPHVRRTGMHTPKTGVRARPLTSGWRRAVVPAAMGLAVVAAAGLGWQFRGGTDATTVADLDTSGRLRTMAVLYFDDLSSGADLGYVTDALTEGLIDQLSRVPEFVVISRNGVAAYRDAAVARDSVARALDVGTLIVGSVEPVRDSLRVTARLIDTESDAEVRRASFTLPAEDLLRVRDSVATEVSLSLRGILGEEVRLREQRAQTASVAAWTLVQRAEKARKDGMAAIEHDDVSGGFAQLLRADSLFGLAEDTDDAWPAPSVSRGEIAYQIARLMDPRVEAGEARQYLQSAIAHAERALTRDARYAPALELRGTAQYYGALVDLAPVVGEGEDWLVAAERDLRAAVAEDHSLASAHNTLSHLFLITGNVVDAVREARDAYDEDAYLDVADAVLWRLYEGHYELENHVEASRWCQEGRRRFPSDFRFAECQLWLMAAGAVTPDVNRAWNLAAELGTNAPADDRAFYRETGRIITAGVLARAELPDSARAVLAGIRSDRAVDPHLELPFFQAYIRTLLGDHDEAIDLLKRYLAAHPEQDHGVSGGLAWWWRPLRDHPRFGEIAGTG